MYAALRKPFGRLFRMLLVVVFFMLVVEIAKYYNENTLQSWFIGTFGETEKESVSGKRRSYNWKPKVKSTHAPVGFIVQNDDDNYDQHKEDKPRLKNIIDDRKVVIKIGKEESHKENQHKENYAPIGFIVKKDNQDNDKDEKDKPLLKKETDDHKVDVKTGKESHIENRLKGNYAPIGFIVKKDNKDLDKDADDKLIDLEKNIHGGKVDIKIGKEENHKSKAKTSNNGHRNAEIKVHDLEKDVKKNIYDHKVNIDTVNEESHIKYQNKEEDDKHDHDKGDDKHDYHKGDDYHDLNEDDGKRDHDKGDDKHGHDGGDDKHHDEYNDKHHNKDDDTHDNKGDNHYYNKDDDLHHNKGDNQHGHNKDGDKHDHIYDKGDDIHHNKGDDKHDHNIGGDTHYDKGDIKIGKEEHHKNHKTNQDKDKGGQNDKSDIYKELHTNTEKMRHFTSHRHGRKGDYVEHIYKTISYKGNPSDATIKESAKSLVQLALHKAKHKLTTNDSKMEVLGYLARKVAIDKTLFVSIVDSSFAEMAINLLETSYLKFNITNFLFVCIDQRAKDLLPRKAGQCYVHSDIGTAVYSKYHTPQFNQKTKIKNDVSLDLMLLGFTVIITDLDIVFFKNPLPYLKCDECDLMIQDNYNGILNSGFYLIKPTNASIALQQLSISNSSKTSDDQDVLNFYAQLLYYSNILKVRVLDLALFQPGRVYFDNGNRFFHTDAACKECVLVHNNFVKGYVKKVYRMKELLLWTVDVDSHLGYYSCPRRMYLTYTNPTGTTNNQQIEALQVAFNLGKLLDRTVILPQFNLGTMRCHFTAAFTSKIWKKYNWKLYRENSFLLHPKVPIQTKTKVSPPIGFTFGEKEQNIFNNNSVLLVLTQTHKLNFVNELAQMIINNPDINGYKVLNFTSLVFD